MMILPIAISALMVSLGGVWMTAPAAPHSIGGSWAGGYEVRGSYTPIRVHFVARSDGLKGTLDLLMKEETGVALNQVRLESGLHFELTPRSSAAIAFDGRPDGDVITGTIRQGSDSGTFHLARIAKVNPAALDPYVGDYRIAPDRYISIEPTTWPSRGIAFTDSGTRRFGYLFPSSESTFFAGPGRLVPYPVEVQAAFMKNKEGQVALSWKPNGSPELSGTKVRLYEEKEVSFSNGDVTLAGTLTLPVGKGPHPAVVLIHGSDPHTRFTGTTPHLFSMHGLAVLSYDKRGAGRSTGDRSQATLDVLATDASAAVRFLQSRADIRPKQVGLWAIGQGGWIAPLVAARTPHVAFMILHAGAAVTPRAQARMELELSYPHDGYTREQTWEAAAFQSLYFDAMRSDEAYLRLRVMYEQAKARGATWAWDPGPRETLQQNWFRLIMDHDPLPALEKTTCPVLAFFGEKDSQVPPDGNVEPMQRALRRARNMDVTIRVLPGANHQFEESATGFNDFTVAGRIVPGYQEVMFDWLKKRTDSP